MSRLADAIRKAEAARRAAREEQSASDAPDEASVSGGDGGTFVPWTLDDVQNGEPAQPEDGSETIDVTPDASARRRLPVGRRVAHGASLGPKAPARTLTVVPDNKLASPQRPDLMRYRDVVRRRWPTGFVILLIVVAGVFVGLMLTPPVYRATGMLEIRKEATGAPPLQALFESESVASDDLETQFGILKSVTLSQRVVQELTRERVVNATPDGPQLEVGDVQAKLLVNPQKGSRLVEVSYDAATPALAARVVNSLFDNYRQVRMAEAKVSQGWLEQQLTASREKLDEAEDRLQAFVRNHSVQVLETGKGETADLVNQRLKSLHDALARAQADRIDRQSALEQATRQISNRNLDSPVVQSLSVRLADLRREHAKLTSVFHEDYPSVKAINSEIAELERAMNGELSLVVDRLEREYQAAVRKEALVHDALDRQNDLVQSLSNQSADSVGYETLKRDVVTKQQQFTVLDQKLKEVSISAALKAAAIGIVDPAIPPTAPYGFSFQLSLALAIAVGLVLGCGGMLLREHLDTSMRSAEDVDAYLGIRTLAAIPSVRPESRLLPAGVTMGAWKHWRPIDPAGRSESPLGEAFAALRTAVLLNDDLPAPRALLITSAQSEEGKTTVSINLAVSLAKLKHRVLLVDANMRYPCIKDALGLSDGHGLVGCLTGEVEWRACVRPQVRPNLDVLVGGKPQTTSPADLLSLPRMKELLAAASREYDFVVLDSPALLVHPADVQSLATLADSVLFTVRQGATPREDVSLALSRLPRVSGVVLNRYGGRDIPIFQQDAAEGST